MLRQRRRRRPSTETQLEQHVTNNSHIKLTSGFLSTAYPVIINRNIISTITADKDTIVKTNINVVLTLSQHL